MPVHDGKGGEKDAMPLSLGVPMERSGSIKASIKMLLAASEVSFAIWVGGDAW